MGQPVNTLAQRTKRVMGSKKSLKKINRTGQEMSQCLNLTIDVGFPLGPILYLQDYKILYIIIKNLTDQNKIKEH